jgi:hypothetical protein
MTRTEVSGLINDFLGCCPVDITCAQAAALSFPFWQSICKSPGELREGGRRSGRDKIRIEITSQIKMGGTAVILVFPQADCSFDTTTDVEDLCRSEFPGAPHCC